MGRKAKKLPPSFNRIMSRGDYNELIHLYDKLEITAHSEIGEWCLPFYIYTPCSEFYIWLVDKGLDINTSDPVGKTALHEMATCYYNNVEGLIKAGANIEACTIYDKWTPLHYAAKAAQPSAAFALMQYGANVNALDRDGRTPLDLLFIYSNVRNIVRICTVARMLCEKQAKVTIDISDKIVQLGKEFEHQKELLYTEDIISFEKAMEELYELFDVEPVKSLVVHDGVSRITVQSDNYEDMYEELWNMLVPAIGHCQTVQGEVVRIGGRVYEWVRRDGGLKWREDYYLMLKMLPMYYEMGVLLDEEEHKEACKLAEKIDYDSDLDDIWKLCELNIKWVLKNTEPILLKSVPYSI